MIRCVMLRDREGGGGPLGGSPRSGSAGRATPGVRVGAGPGNGYRTSWTASKCSLDFDLCLVQTKLAARRGPGHTQAHKTRVGT